MRLRRILWVSALTVLVAFPMAGLSGQAKAQEPKGTQSRSRMYIVQLAETPVTAYRGTIPGFAATRPAQGEKVDPSDPNVAAYDNYLVRRHDSVLGHVGGGRKAYSYRHVFNGFAAELTDDQVAKLQSMPDVLSVSKDELREMDTSTTPAFLGLTERGGLWDRLGGPRSAGTGVIIGLIDSGIWPESPSFDDPEHPRDHHRGREMRPHHIQGWHGKCVSGQAFDDSLCNDKLIGAQWFNEAWGGDSVLEATLPWEYMSARDYNGHGTHTSSTAGGNYGVRVPLVYRTINGMAPGARLAMYKALWSTVDASTAIGYNSDLVAAIDQAVKDGVDVLNYSISGTTTNFRDPVEIAFMSAADAGVFVAASAGNSGPTTGTVAHPSPWITTVAAGTHNRSALGSATLGDGSVYNGVSAAGTTVTAPLIDATAAAATGQGAAARLCYSTASNNKVAALDPAKVKGKIVVCDRGMNARVDKSLAVYEAGGVGMILVNVSFDSLVADFHSVPTVHLQNTAYAAVHAYAATAGAKAKVKAWMDFSTAAPYTASFSSRGPLAASGDLLKPDLLAPGQDIMAAVAPPGNSGATFGLYSGTSMSSPHVAGLAALLKALHRDWTPMMIKSALMTTAYDILDGPNTDPLVIFRQGAGHVDPNPAMDPGLVFDSDMNDWLGFLCGTQLGADYCTSRGIPVLDPSDLNTPSIAIAELAGAQTVTRTVTSVGEGGIYHVSVTGLSGLNVTVSPASFVLRHGHSRKLKITIARTTAALNAYTGGYLTWSDGRHFVRVPVVVKPVPLSAPTEVTTSYNVAFGYDGTFTAAARGLVPATTFVGFVATGYQLAYTVLVPSDTTYARFSLFDANVTAGSDLDLAVYLGSTLVGSSGGSTSTEEVDLLDPTPGTYTVYVQGYATANPSTFTLFTWVLGATASGNMVVAAPATATLGAKGAINLSFSGLTAGTKYLGSVAYFGTYGDGTGNVSGLPNPTIVRIDK